MLCRLLANDVDYTNVDQIDEELERRHFARLARPPQQALVEVLSDLRPAEELERVGRAVAVLLLGIVAVEAGGVGIGGSQVRGVTELVEASIERHGVVRQNVQLGIEDVKLVANVLELLVDVCVLTEETVTLGLASTMQSADGIDVLAGPMEQDLELVVLVFLSELGDCPF
jgi:hypothetical protein